MSRSTGFNRLSIAVAIITPPLMFFLIGTLADPRPKEALGLAIFSLLCGFLAWGLVRLVAWVMDGFTR